MLREQVLERVLPDGTVERRPALSQGGVASQGAQGAGASSQEGGEGKEAEGKGGVRGWKAYEEEAARLERDAKVMTLSYF